MDKTELESQLLKGAIGINKQGARVKYVGMSDGGTYLYVKIEQDGTVDENFWHYSTPTLYYNSKMPSPYDIVELDASTIVEDSSNFITNKFDLNRALGGAKFTKEDGARGEMQLIRDCSLESPEEIFPYIIMWHEEGGIGVSQVNMRFLHECVMVEPYQLEANGPLLPSPMKSLYGEDEYFKVDVNEYGRFVPCKVKRSNMFGNRWDERDMLLQDNKGCFRNWTECHAVCNRLNDIINGLEV